MGRLGNGAGNPPCVEYPGLIRSLRGLAQSRLAVRRVRKLSDFGGLMKRAWLAAAFAASLLFGSMSAAIAADDMSFDDSCLENVRFAEERLLGSAGEAAQFAAYQVFTREIAATGVVTETFDAALGDAGVPAAAMLEARQALATVIDLGHDMAAGDRFHVRYEQAFTAEDVPIGVGRVLWAELHTKAKGTVAIHRFRPSGGIERFWLANGDAATPPSMRLPLDVVTVSSGFGLRPDPLDKPSGTMVAMGPLPDQPPSSAAANASAPAPAPEPPVALPRQEPVQAKPASRNVVRGSLIGGQFAFGQTTPHAMLDVGRLEREVAEARRAAAAPPVDVPPDTAAAVEQAHVAKPQPAPRARRLFMHDGADLVASVGTPIYAACDGVVVGAAPNGGYGNWIRIDHPGKLSTVYGHLSEFAPGIEAGALVSRGELIGFVGNTGRSTGAHLHFEILSSGKAVDPLAYPELKRAQLRGADFERFRKQVKRALADRDRETAVALSSSGF